MDQRQGETAEPGPALRLLTLLLFRVIQTGDLQRIKCDYMTGDERQELVCPGGFLLDLTGGEGRAFTFKQRSRFILKTDPVVRLVFVNLFRNEVKYLKVLLKIKEFTF